MKSGGHAEPKNSSLQTTIYLQPQGPGNTWRPYLVLRDTDLPDSKFAGRFAHSKAE